MTRHEAACIQIEATRLDWLLSLILRLVLGTETRQALNLWALVYETRNLRTMMLWTVTLLTLMLKALVLRTLMLVTLILGTRDEELLGELALRELLLVMHCILGNLLVRRLILVATVLLMVAVLWCLLLLINRVHS